MGFVSGVDFVFVPVSDFARAERFYRDVLELECSVRYDKAPGGEFETGSLTLQVFDPSHMGREVTPSSNPIALHVDDYPAAKAKLVERGVDIVHELDSGVCWMAIFRDPDGNTFCLHHRYAPKGERPEAADGDASPRAAG